MYKILIAALLWCGVALGQSPGNSRYVNPFIGTAVQGHTYPGATAPFGLVQVSPETGYVGWNYCAGYHYEDKTILGFSHTHLSGTGWMDLGDVLLMPFTGQATDRKAIKSSFTHKDEVAQPGYYAVNLDDYHVRAELTATQRAAFHKYTFQTKEGKLLIDLKHGIVPDSAALETHVVKSELIVEDQKTLSGHLQTKGWAGDKQVYFVIRFKQPFVNEEWLSDKNAGRNQQIALTFQSTGKLELDVQVGLSTVSIDGARNNLKTEMPGWDFDTTRAAMSKVWDKWLSTIQIDASDRDKTIFYTALYHNLVVPNNIADADGSYRGEDNHVAKAEGGAYYSTLSLWDTFRATNSLYTILYPQVTNGLVQTMLAHYKVKGVLPIWTLWGHENWCMIGNHAIPVIAEAYQKGIRNYDANLALEAMKASETVNHNKSDWGVYLKYGYYPSNLIKIESVSRTLETAYDDWCVAHMAGMLGKKEDEKAYQRRAGFYKNVFDPTSGFMRGRKADGSWVTPFDPLRFSHASTGGDFTEGNAWPYLFHVMHDVPGMISLFGNKECFAAKLDTMFSLKTKAFAQGAKGLIGQYVQGNEPSHHVAYLYNYAGQSWKTQELVNEIKTTLYNETPAGLCGNDDCGQMSAWYMFSAVGFYPVNPADGRYIFGAPSFKRVVLNPGKNQFVVEAENLSPQNIYVQQIKLNGKPYNKAYITHQDLMKGGTLQFIMSDKPNKTPLITD